MQSNCPLIAFHLAPPKSHQKGTNLDDEARTNDLATSTQNELCNLKSSKTIPQFGFFIKVVLGFFYLFLFLIRLEILSYFPCCYSFSAVYLKW